MFSRSEMKAGISVSPIVAVQPAPPPILRAARLGSLDAFRGFIMFWIVGGSALIFGLHNLGGNVVIDQIIRQLHHTDWQGLRFYDLIAGVHVDDRRVPPVLICQEASDKGARGDLLESGATVRRFVFAWVAAGIRSPECTPSGRVEQRAATDRDRILLRL